MTDQIDVLERLRNAERDPYSCIRHPDQRTFLAGDAADEIERLRKALIHCARGVNVHVGDDVSNDFLMHVPEEVMLTVNDMFIRTESAERERDELRGRIAAAPVIITDGTLQWAIHHLDNCRVRLVKDEP